MTTITALPTPPSSADTANFNTRADAFVAALPNFGAEVNAVAAEVNINAIAAASSAALGNAIAWVSATVYALGAARYSLINYQTYRCKLATTAAQVTDPSLDTTYWARVDLAGGSVAPITGGGTGQTTAPLALQALNGATRGVNTDITSLRAITGGMGFANGTDLQFVSGGNIGFGVSPSYKLDSLATGFNTMRLRSSTSGSGAGSALILGENGAGNITLGYNGIGYSSLYCTNSFSLGTSGNNDLSLVTNGSARMSITPAGDVAFQASIGSKLTNVKSINSGPLAGFRNRVINGGMEVDIRSNGVGYNIGYATTAPATTPVCYLSQWFVYHLASSTSGPVSVGRVLTGSYLQARYAMYINGNANLTNSYLVQRLEAANTIDLAGKPATLQAEVSNTLLTTVNWAVYYAGTTDSFGTPAAPSRTLISSGSWTVSSTAAVYSAVLNIPTAATTGLEIVFSVGAQTSGSWYVSNVQLEPGTIATPFEKRPFAVELALCKRYFRALAAGSCMGQAVSATNARLISTGEPMRATPTLVTGSIANLSISNASGTGVTPSAATSTGGSGVDGSVLLDVTVASGLVAGNACYLTTNNAPTSNYLVAEL